MDFFEYWQYTDAISKTLFFILLGLSIVTWIAGILRFIDSLHLKAQAHDLVKNNITLMDRESVEQRLLQNIGRIRHRSEKGLAVMGTTASIAPFIGLFGTVWGIFHALHGIAQAGQAGLAQVAGPVGEALIMTGLGLAVAIPAVIFYNIATRINRNVIYLANDTAYGILANIKEQADSQPQATARISPQTKNKEGNTNSASSKIKEGSYGI